MAQLYVFNVAQGQVPALSLPELYPALRDFDGGTTVANDFPWTPPRREPRESPPTTNEASGLPLPSMDSLLR